MWNEDRQSEKTKKILAKPKKKVNLITICLILIFYLCVGVGLIIFLLGVNQKKKHEVNNKKKTEVVECPVQENNLCSFSEDLNNTAIISNNDDEIEKDLFNDDDEFSYRNEIKSPFKTPTFKDKTLFSEKSFARGVTVCSSPISRKN